MTLAEYEKCLVGELSWCCGEVTRDSFERQCPRKWSYQQRRQQWELRKAFALQASAHHAAKVVGVSYPTAYQSFVKFRLALARLAARQLFGEIELDESYFGGHRHPRARRAKWQGCWSVKARFARCPTVARRR